MVVGDLLAAPLAPQQFDLVFCLGVLHHLERPELGFRNVAEFVSRNGLLIVYVYEPGIPKLMLLRKIIPRSWRLPEPALIGIARATGITVGCLKFALRRWRWKLGDAIANYTLGAYDVLSPRWSWEVPPPIVLRWYERAGFDARKIEACTYVGIRREA